MLWTHQAFSVAACIVIYFDILHSSSSAQDGSHLVVQTIEQLQLCRKRSMIAARGVKILNALQSQVIEKAENRKRPLENAIHQSSSKRRRGFNAAKFARSFCDIESGSSHSSHLQERQEPATEVHLRPQQIPEIGPVTGMDESPDLPTDLNWIWNMPTVDQDSTHPFDSLLSFANQGLGF